ncbi:chromosomal replication initiator protein DnaA [Candidatus Saccharibacteria bacterium]|nr:chromosomal replication initiator protein DnaA [Candidatus Saccharibacteria bacterium]
MFDVWKNVLSEIEETIPHSAFTTWFTDVNLVSEVDGKIVIEAPNVFKVTQIQKKYDKLIQEAFSHNKVEFKEIQYIVSNKTRIKPRSREITLNEINKKVYKDTPVVDIEHSIKKFKTGLKPNYTMDNFIVGSNNNIAAAVASAVIKNPGGNRYNPFFLYGGPGLGKTHLVQAIGNEIVKNNPNLKVLYMPTSQFFSEFVTLIRKQKGDDFTKKYQDVDVLIMDDFQAIINKNASQEAFFNIFNDLYQRGKQIIVTSDRLPDEIETLDERLSSRLAWAGAYDLQLPSFEDKCAILKAKAEYDNVEIEDEAIEYIAKIVKTNIRDLEKEYTMLLTWAEVKGVTPLEIINSGGYSSNNSDKSRNIVTPKQILQAVANYYELSVKEMCGKSRVFHIKNARQVAMYLLSEELGMSTTNIAMEVGVKDHTTVMHGVKKIREDLKLDFTLREQIASIREGFYA